MVWDDLDFETKTIIEILFILIVVLLLILDFLIPSHWSYPIP
ncbi:MAG: hypothetical protein XD90_0957 [Methanobacterium sp. 42_16]|nr:MAG: hypothetical protein XD90_0957 [Methanobacterium sp. 42_16]